MQCTSCLTKQVCTRYCIYINYSNSLTYCAFFYGKTGTKMSYSDTMCSLQTWRHASCTDVRRRKFQTQTPTAWPGTWCPLSTARAELISLLATAACASLNPGHSHGWCQRIVNSSDSFIHSLSNAGLQVTGSRYMT